MGKKIVIVVACLLVSVPAMADMAGVRFSSVESSSSTTLAYYNGPSATVVSYKGVLTGDYRIELGASTSGPLPSYLTSGVQPGICIDIQDLSTSGWQDYTVLALKDAPDAWAGPMGPTRAAYVQQLLDRYWGKATTNAGALQIAVWELVDEGRHAGSVPALGTFNAESGDFSASGSLAALANTYLGGLTGLWTAKYDYTALSNTVYQDFVVRAVPVPGAVLLGMLGLGYAGVRLRRKCG